MTVQLAIRVDDRVAADLDSLVPARYANRTVAIRAALDEFIDRERRAEIGRQIVAGYKRFPPGELHDEVAAAAQRSVAQLDDWDWDGDDAGAG